jgi:ribonuclease VapC
MSPEAAVHARSAYERYGKGVGSPGVLNFGDCLSYGVARAAGEPLLFKGDDFSATDIDAAVY